MRPGDRVGRYFYAYEVARSETADRWGIDNTPTEEIWENARRLCTVLDPIRDFAGPINVASWYRCRSLNQKVGGQINSLHLYGCAADIRPAVKDVRLGEIMAYLKECPCLAYEEAILETGRWTKWIHVAVPRDPLAVAKLELLSLTKGQRARPWVPSDQALV